MRITLYTVFFLGYIGTEICEMGLFSNKLSLNFLERSLHLDALLHKILFWDVMLIIGILLQLCLLKMGNFFFLLSEREELLAQSM